MTDETPDSSRLLASAAFDNEATTDERAQVDASAELREEVAFYGQLRSAIAEVEVPAESREAAIAAALAAFDDAEPAGHDTEAVATVTSLAARRKSQLRWVGGAAAAVIIAVGIGFAVRSDGQDNDSTAGEATSASLAEASKQSTEMATADQSTDSLASASAAGAAPEASVANSSPPPASLGSIEGPASVSSWIDAPVLNTPDDVAAFVASDGFGGSSLTLATEPVEPAASEAPNPEPATTPAVADSAQRDSSRVEYIASCGLDASQPSGFAVYAGQNVVVIRDESTHRAVVLEPTTCQIVTSVALG